MLSVILSSISASAENASHVVALLLRLPFSWARAALTAARACCRASSAACNTATTFTVVVVVVAGIVAAPQSDTVQYFLYSNSHQGYNFPDARSHKSFQTLVEGWQVRFRFLEL